MACHQEGFAVAGEDCLRRKNDSPENSKAATETADPMVLARLATL
jgi:hypothetical protein